MTTTSYTPKTPVSERPVFLAENGRRARILGIAAKVAFVVTVLWLAALAAGMLGFGQLPGTSVNQPFSRLINGSGDASEKQASSTDLASVTATARAQSARAQAIVAKRRAAARTAAARARSSRAVRQAPAPDPAPAVQPPAGQAVVAQQPSQQGWVRRGYVSPPGQVRRVQPQPPPPAQPGNGYGRARKVTPPLPLLPPPPPPGNGNGNGGPKLK
jgi:hypothetical protein